VVSELGAECVGMLLLLFSMARAFALVTFVVDLVPGGPVTGLAAGEAPMMGVKGSQCAGLREDSVVTGGRRSFVERNLTRRCPPAYAARKESIVGENSVQDQSITHSNEDSATSQLILCSMEVLQ
jgi:hypothetical protein